MKSNDKITAAVKQFHETLKKVGVERLCIIYSYKLDNDGYARMGFEGASNDAIATCERLKNHILNDSRNHDHEEN